MVPHFPSVVIRTPNLMAGGKASYQLRRTLETDIMLVQQNFSAST